MKVPCGGFDLDESVFNVDKNSKQVKLNSPISYDYMPEGYPKKDGWSIEWDGNTEGLTYVPAGGGFGFYKISDFLPTDDELIGATLEVSNGKSIEITSGEINSSLYPGMTMVGSLILIVRKDNFIANGITLPEKGVYEIYDGGMYAKKLSNESVTLMSEEFIPSIPVDKLPDIPVDKLPDIPVIEFSTSIHDTILNPTQPSYSVGSLNYTEILNIISKGCFAIKDGNNFYEPVSWTVSSNGVLSINIISTTAKNVNTLVYATLACNNGGSSFYRDAYWTVTATKG